jgi:glycerol-3-phosphate acyltransferase PlsY
MLPAVAVIAALLVWRHRGNIARLAAGTESRIGSKKAS